MTGSDPTTVAHLVDRLWRAEVNRVAVAPLSADTPDLSVDAYAVQTCNIDSRVAAGAVVRGRKVG
jgi:2-keto-4-pentenoate hydratase